MMIIARSRYRVLLISINTVPSSKTEQASNISGNTVSRVQKNTAYHESMRRYDSITSAKALTHRLSRKIPDLQIIPISASNTPTRP